MYTRDVKLSFPNNSIKKIHTLNFYPLCHNFDEFSGEWPIYMCNNAKLYVHALNLLFDNGCWSSHTLDCLKKVTVSESDHTCRHPHKFSELATKKWIGNPRLASVAAQHPTLKTPVDVLPWHAGVNGNDQADSCRQSNHRKWFACHLSDNMKCWGAWDTVGTVLRNHTLITWIGCTQSTPIWTITSLSSSELANQKPGPVTLAAWQLNIGCRLTYYTATSVLSQFWLLETGGEGGFLQLGQPAMHNSLGAENQFSLEWC